MFEFSIQHSDAASNARVGSFTTPHGTITTPVFMPVGTRGTVKTLTPVQLRELGADIILANTFHLFLQPGSELIRHAGGLHKWIKWDGPILTDSGGFQVFSLANIRQIRDDGIEFQSPLDGGAKHFLTPERVMEIQADLGADIIMAFDECAPGTSTVEYARAAMERTHRWAQQCKDHQQAPDKQALFPIIQGVIYPELRVESAKFITNLDLPGIAIGGLSVGESKEDMYRILDVLAPHLPKNKPHYLMGVGSPEDLVQAVLRGIDMFDCVLPTRLGRTGSIFSPDGRVNIQNARFKTSSKPLQASCTCYTCSNFSGSYIHHLVKEKEILGMVLLTMHNLHFLLRLMEEIRHHIKNETFASWSRDFLKRYVPMGGQGD